MNQLNKKQLFNPRGDDSIENRTIIMADTTNLLNLNDVKYPWATGLYREMLANHWIPEKIDMSRDKHQYLNDLEIADREAFDLNISFLTFLDSLQTNNIPNIFEYITAPEVTALGAIQTFQEVVHSQSYAYIFESVIPFNRRKEVYYLWRDNPVLFGRNKYIADIYQEFVDKPSLFTFYKSLIANYILESVYFYNGFNYFYGLEYKGLMMGAADEIRYIHRDESTHVALFRNIIHTIHEEFDLNFDYKDLIYEMFNQACDEEIKWGHHVFKNKVVGHSDSSIEASTKKRVNERLMDIDLEPIYPGFDKDPYQYLERHSAEQSGVMKNNFFEVQVTEYNQSSVLTGWEKV